MEITNFELKPSKIKLSEGTIFNGVKDFIKTSNFPKKMVLKKLDMLIEKRKNQTMKYMKILKLSKKAEEDMLNQINSLRSRNDSDIQKLIEFLSD